MKIKKILLIIFFISLPILCRAEGGDQKSTLPDKIFTAKVMKVIRDEAVKQEDGTTLRQQDLELSGLDGEYKGKKIIIKGINDPENTSKNIYKENDKVTVDASFDENGNVKYYITDYVRTDSLLFLAIIFVVSLVVVGRWTGVRSLLSLVVTFLVVMKYMIPQILDGADPIITTLIGSIGIMLAIIYITDGFNARSHIAVASIFTSLTLTVFISWVFVDLTRLTGLANEEASFLVGLGNGMIVNFKGLLLAGIIIGALGVLDDVVLSQVAAVEEIRNAGERLGKYEVYKRAYKIGVAHISSMTNTLFLAYAGASLPLLILFIAGQSSFANASQAFNNESLATEAVRTLAGSIGLILAVPISTALAVLWYNKKD